MLQAKYSFQNLIAPPQLLCLARREKSSHYKKHTGTHSCMLPQRSRQQTIEMVKFESPTLNSELIFSRDQFLSYPTTLVPVAAGDKSTHTCTFFKLSHFIALLAECTESSSARVSSQDIAFTSKLLWYPHACSCATQWGTTGEEEEQRVSCTHMQPDPSLPPLLMSRHTRRGPKSAMAAPW